MSQVPPLSLPLPKNTDEARQQVQLNNWARKVTNAFNAGLPAGLALTPTPFANLPQTNLPMIACVSDSNTATWGAVIAGGGTHQVLAFWNGSQWTVAGI